MRRTPEIHDYVAYVDGSYHTKTNKASWGLVIYYNDKIVHEDSGYVDYNKLPEDSIHSRQVAGELYAAMQAVQWAISKGTKVFIVYDFIGIKNWIDGDWKPKKDLTKHYAAYMKKNINCIAGLKWVKGHSKDPGNERANELAWRVIANDKDFSR